MPGPRRSAAPLPAVLAALALAAACGGPPPPPPSSPPPRDNVVLLVVDTLRAQDLSAYGYGRDTSPQLEALAREGVLFEDVRSQAPCTYPSANSILTGRLPADFLGQPGQALGIPESIPSLAELLHAQGYATAAVSASPIVRATPSRRNPTGGFGRGFDRFDEGCEWTGARCVTRHGLAAIDAVAEPFFLYLHFMDPHDPYRPPKTWSRRFADPEFAGRRFIAKGDPNRIAERLAKPGGTAGVTDEEVAHLVDLYDDEIAYFDAQLGAFHRELKNRDLLERSILVLVADHGESFLEHGSIKHCRTLYDTEIRTPMVVRLPRLDPGRRGRRIPHQVANLDLVPTLLDVLGVQPPSGLDGVSLRPLVERDEPVRDLVVSSWGSQRAAKRDRFKLIADLATEQLALYDVAADPGETRDVAAEHPAELRALWRDLRAWLDRHEGQRAESVRRFQEAHELLHSLGYLE